MIAERGNQTGQDRQLPFVPAWLDDLGLTPIEFRVVCRISRRGDCTECLRSMAAKLRVNRNTLQTAISGLIGAGIVTRSARPGSTSVLRLAPCQSWRCPDPNREPAENRSQPKQGAEGGLNEELGVAENRSQHLAENESHEGNPLKVIQEGGEPPAIAEEGRDFSWLDWPSEPIPAGEFRSGLETRLRAAEEMLKSIRRDDRSHWIQTDEHGLKIPKTYPEASKCCEAWQERIKAIKARIAGAGAKRAA